MHNAILEQPLIEPVTLDEVKTYLRVDSHQENNLLEQLIKTARRMIEDYTSRAMITQTHRVIAGVDEVMTLPMAPFQNIVAKPKVLTGKSSEVVQNYRLDLSRPQARLYLAHRFAQESSFQIDYRVGYGDSPMDVPEPLRQALLLLVADLYENRPGETTNKAGIHALPGLVRSMLDPYRIIHLN